jgi:plasmid stabilization system protein ParE
VKLRFLPLARVELRAAAAYYRAISPALAVSFVDEALDVRRLIDEHPLAWHTVEPPFRQCRFHRFPYAFIYEVLETEVVIVAVPHLMQKPGYWHDRLGF